MGTTKSDAELQSAARRALLIGGASAAAVAAVAHTIKLPYPTLPVKQHHRMGGAGQFSVQTIAADWPVEPPYGLLIDDPALDVVQDIWAKANVDWDSASDPSAGVPAVFTEQLIQPLGDLDTNAKKSAFLLMMLPHVALANHIIEVQRQRLKKILAGTGLPLNADKGFVAALAKKMRLSEQSEMWVKTLLDHIDVIPTSLALAQAATESGWGTSRFAREGNALFGVWTWEEGAGIIPEGREEGKTHSVKAYGNLFQTVTDYMDNLNRHPAYADLRAIRAAARAQGAEPSGHHMAEGLIAYSQRREIYVEELQAIIRVNDLAKLDGIQMSMQPPQLVG